MKRLAFALALCPLAALAAWSVPLACVAAAPLGLLWWRLRRRERVEVVTGPEAERWLKEVTRQ